MYGEAMFLVVVFSVARLFDPLMCSAFLMIIYQPFPRCIGANYPVVAANVMQMIVRDDDTDYDDRNTSENAHPVVVMAEATPL
jgi:hypothetical protein